MSEFEKAIFGRRSGCSSAPLTSLEADRILLPDGREISEFRQLILEDFGVVVRKASHGCPLVLKQLKQDEASARANLPKFFADIPPENFAEKEISLDPMTASMPSIDSGYILSINHASAISFSHMTGAA